MVLSSFFFKEEIKEKLLTFFFFIYSVKQTECGHLVYVQSLNRSCSAC